MPRRNIGSVFNTMGVETDESPVDAKAEAEETVMA
jgi:hypothetical protein